MKLLAIETSCDETAVAILEANGTDESASFTVLGNALYSQIAVHREFGGVFPALAKREHAKNLVPLLSAALSEAGMRIEGTTEIDPRISELLSREYALAEELSALLSSIAIPDIDAVAVTRGPGLEPALWVGVNFAQALSIAWNKPLVPVDHMEGHLLVSLIEGDTREFRIPKLEVPVLGLLVSGGHTELIVMNEWLSYELLGSTRDDAVGEAFDKVARMLGFPYPGGPEISKIAMQANKEKTIALPRPMIDAPNFDFSFSGLKTAVMYMVKDRELSEQEKADVAGEFQDAAVEVLCAKTARALTETGARTLAIGGGVSANAKLREQVAKRIKEDFPDVALRLPPLPLTGDNAVMIGIAGFYHAKRKEYAIPGTIIADGNLHLHQ